MRSITKMLFTFVLLCVAGVTHVYADDEVELTADMFYIWDGYGADATYTSVATVDFNIGNDAELGSGSMVCGTSTVDYLTYADLTGSTKLIISGTPGMQFRVLMNRQESNSGPLVEKNPTIGEDGIAELDLTDLSYVHINAIKTGWGSSAGKVSSIKFVKPSDPLAVPKEALKNAINVAKLYNGLAYTEATFTNLSNAITDGNRALAAEGATQEMLTDATTAINNAITALAFKENFISLQDVPFGAWNGWGADAEMTQAGTPTWVLFTATGQSYGDPSVNSYADVSAYDKLYIVTVSGTPRILLNRTADGGQWNENEEESNLIDNTKGGWSAKYFSQEEKVFIVDLKQLVADKGFAHLTAIKSFDNNVISGLYLYKAAEETPSEGTIIAWEADKQGYDNATEIGTVNLDESIQAVFDKNTNNNAPKYYTTGTAVRCYGGNTITISGDKVAISLVQFSFGDNDGSNEITADKGTYKDGLWTIDENTNIVKFTIGGTTGNRRIVAIKVVYTVDENAQEIVEVHIANTAETAYDVAEAVELIEAGEALGETVFVKGMISKIEKVNIDAEDASKNYITYWISADGTENGQQFECYKGLSKEGLAYEDIEVGAEVIVSGTMKKYTPKQGDPIYEFNAGNTIVSYNAPVAPQPFEPVDYTNAIINAEFNPSADPIGWTENVSASFKDFGMGSIGSYKVRDEFAPATIDETHIESDYCAALECRWASSFASYQQTVTLKAGDYKLTYDVENVNAGTTSANYNNLFTVTVGEEIFTDNSTEWMNGKSSWTTHSIVFSLAQDAAVTIRLGYGTGENNFHLSNTPALFVSHLNLATCNLLSETKEAAIAAIEALAPIGDGLFTYTQTDIDAAKNAVLAAKTIDELNAVEMPAPKAPDATKAYAITNATAEGNLCIATEKVTVAKDAAIYFTAVEGGFILSNDEGEYVFKTTDNNWTLSTTTNIEEAYIVTVVPVEGGYTIKGAKGLFGLDTVTEGSTVYANKSQNNNGLWTIAEWVAPVEPTEDYTAYIVNADLTGTEPAGFDATGTKGIDGSGIVKAGNNAVYDFKQTITGLPAGKYVVSVQAAYRYGADEQTEAEAYFNDNIETKFAKLYATVGTKTVDVLVKNRYDGASDTDWANGEGSVMVMGKPVPNSSAAVKAWFDAKQYTNEVTFNLVEAGDVTIGIVKTAQPEAGDYTVIGPWTLTRIGDADEEEPEPQPQPGLIADGKYYFFNVATEQYLAAGADWGTHAVVNSDGVEYTVALADGKYTIDSQISNGGDNHYLNGEWNDGAAMGWTIAEVREGVYTLSNGEKFLTAQDNGVVTLQDDATAITAMWTLVTPEARLSELANATADAPVNATFLITDANFGRNDLRQSAWTIDAANKNLSGGNNTNNCAESFHSVFTLSQTLANAPKGVYALTAQGFYRQDGSDDENLPVFFANDETAKFPLKTGSENSMSDASNSFTNGAYTIDPIYVEINDGETLTIGAKLEGNTNLWCIWDNFQLTYYGTEANIEELRYAGLIAQLAELKNEATTFIDGGEVSAHTTIALQAAVRGADTVESSEESYNAAISALKEAIAQAKKDVVNKAAIDAMYALIESTNVYTAEALETYKRAADDYKAAFEEGTLTVTVDNPAALHGWRTNNDYDDLLLSAWTIDGVQASDFTTDLYINNWSVEGENDGSEFFVPFFEYWTGDGNSLAERTLAANMTNLPAGNYTISAWVRVRAKNGYTAPAYGITLSGNDGEAVDVAAGNQIGTSQFYINEYTANCVVGADGKLTIQFNIAADNNISWLSFKNVKFEKVSEVGVNGIAIDASNDAIYDLTGRRVKTPVKGSLYIINGKKQLVK